MIDMLIILLTLSFSGIFLLVIYMNYLYKLIDKLEKKIDMERNLENIWHDASEEPKGEYKIICLDTLGNVWLTNRKQDMKHHQTGWLECTMCKCIVLWAYVKDLLPKGGEQ